MPKIILQKTDGVNHPNSKLSNEQVYAIRQEYDDGKRGVENAHRYGISGSTYNDIGRRDTWRKLKEKPPMIFAIDAGTFESAYVRTDCKTIASKGIVPNEQLLAMLRNLNKTDRVAIEMIACYGMPVGREVFETCLWIGRFIEAYESTHFGKAELIYRREVKLELCGSLKAKDANIRQALIDIFPQTGGGKTPAIGTKTKQGELYGMKSHLWAALGVAFVFDKKRTQQ